MAEPSDTTPTELNTALPDQPYKKRIAQFDHYYDMRTFSYKLRKSAKQKNSEHGNKYALIIRRKIDSRGIYSGTVIDIKSARLASVLLDINKGVEDLTLSRTEPEVTEELMCFSYPGLLERLVLEQKQEEKDELLICDIQAAIYYVNEHLGGRMLDVNQMLSRREIAFDAAWALFIPNSLVYSHHTDTNQDTVLIVRRSRYEGRKISGVYFEYLEIVCDIIHDDGHGFGFARRVLEIDQYPGTRPITSLLVYPLKYHDDHDGVYSRAVELGKRLVQLPTHSFREISGRASRRVDRHDSEDARLFKLSKVLLNGGSLSDSVETEPVVANGRVMISPFAYARFHSTISPPVYRPLSKDSLTDDEYAICSPIARGYAMDRKVWGEFALTRACDVVWDDTAFDSLVLGLKQKKLIHSLVLQHAKKEHGFDDIIKGKGRGLIGLLSGTPGCGKTLTAEAVAEVTHKPLYTLSAGELGITPATLESTLDKVLELGQMWDAVLLLDEAEVFLTQRNFTDLGRNALVSIFLRRLEYYQGILILTTNMPKNFDSAFASRIHFSINYPELDFTSRKIIWSTFFKRSSTHISDEELSRLALYPINGRQIKNTFSSALTISRAEDSPPGSLLNDLDVVLGVLNEWDQAVSGGSAVVDWEGDIL